MARKAEFESQFPERQRHPEGDPFHVPEGHSVTTFGRTVKNKPMGEIDIPGAIGEHWHGGKHVTTLRTTSTQDPYSGNVMHHALVETKDHWGKTRHHVMNMHADGSVLNSDEGPLPQMQRLMDNHENDTDLPTGSIFDPLPHGYKDKYGEVD